MVETSNTVSVFGHIVFSIILIHQPPVLKARSYGKSIHYVEKKQNNK